MKRMLALGLSLCGRGGAITHAEEPGAAPAAKLPTASRRPGVRSGHARGSPSNWCSRPK